MAFALPLAVRRALPLALGLATVLAGPRLARANGDWLNVDVPRPLDGAGAGLRVLTDVTERQGWMDGLNVVPLVDADGQYKVQDLVRVDTRLDLRLRGETLAEADLPVVSAELAPPAPEGGVNYYTLGTPGVEEAQGFGDLRLGLRGALLGHPGAAEAGWGLSVIAPTGLGPMEAPQTLAATGEGRWQAVPELTVGGVSDVWDAWLQVAGRFQAGQSARAQAGTYVSWAAPLAQPGGPNLNRSLTPGTLWLAPRAGGDAVAALAWIWYRDAKRAQRMELGCEALAHWLSPWASPGSGFSLPPELSFVLQPELKARYAGLDATFGWRAEYLWAQEVPWARYGEFLFAVGRDF